MAPILIFQNRFFVPKTIKQERWIVGKEGGLHDAMLGPRGGGIGIHLLSSTFSCVVFSLSWGCDVEVASVASGKVL